METSMCRCCASEGTFKDFRGSYEWMGEEEIYADMLRECFDVCLSTSTVGDGGICEVCITQLRNASNFKKQVLRAEEQFLKHVQNKLFHSDIVKQEASGDDPDSNDDDNTSDWEPEFEVPIKAESPDEVKPKKRVAKSKATATTSSSKKPKTEPAAAAVKRAQDDAGTKVTPKLKPKKKSRLQAEQEMEKHKQNLITILEASNATPILRHGGIGYMCSYCLKEFPDARDLKKHCIENHKDTGKVMINLSKRENLVDYTAKVDITDLVCEICSKEINSLDDLFVHLKEIHEIVIHDVPNHIIPFKFYSDKFDCYICSSWFENFKPLLEHMHSHYRNFVCSICDKGFVNRSAWRSHERRHIVGTFPCRFCDSVYDTLARRVSHEITAHLNVARLVCGYCHKRFEYIGRKNEHMVKEHGVKPKKFECKSCDGVFSSQAQLSKHVKKQHLMLRNHKCTECEMAFYSVTDLKNHMIKHNKERNFQCLICLKSFSRKKVLLLHMRIHNNDKRYACDLCGQAFIQNASLKMHMKNKHGQTEKGLQIKLT